MVSREFINRVLQLNWEFINLKIKQQENPKLDFTASFEILYSMGFELMEELGKDNNKLSLLTQKSLLKISNELLAYTSKEFVTIQEEEMNKRNERLKRNGKGDIMKNPIGFSAEK